MSVPNNNTNLALSEGDARYRAIVEGAEEFAIIMLDRHGVITSWNSGAERLLGFTETEAVGQPGDIFFTPEQRENGDPDREMSRARAEGRALNERWHQRKDGSRFWGSGLMMLLEESGSFLKIFRDRTAEHEAEQRLRDSREELQAVLDAVPAAIWIARDPEAKTIIGNRESYRLLELAEGVNASLSADESERPNAFKIFRNGRELSPDELPVQRAARGETVRQFEEELRFDNGQTLHLLGNASPLRDPDGKARGSVAAFIDITEAKRAELQSQASEQRFRTLAETIGQVFYLSGTRERKLLYVSPAFDEIWGFSRSLLFDRSRAYADAIHPDDQARAFEAYQEQEAGRETQVEYRIRRPDGTERWILDRSYPVLGEDGLPVWAAGLAEDITEQRRAADALAQARQEAERRSAEQAAILGQLAEGVIVTDAKGEITFVNDAAARLHGVAKLGVAPDDYAQTYHLFRESGEPYPPDELPLARAVRDGETVVDARWLIRRPDGSEVLAIGSARPVLVDGTPIGAVLTVRDDTARAAAEAALRDLNETLEERVTQRQLELEAAQEALRQSQKLEAMGQLTGGVAHDFNNLLTPIIGGLDLLHRRGLGGDRERRLMEGALQSAERAKTLVQRLLAFARRQPLQPRAIDVGELVGGMTDLIASTLGPQIRVVARIEPDLPAARADLNQVEMALLNLSVNARDAMPDGGTLTLSASRVELVEPSPDLAPGLYVRLSVADTGVGMEEDTLRRAVEPFFSTKGIGKGTGLGLSMVHGLALQLGGRFFLSSAPGLGTNAELWLSAADREGELQAPEAVRPVDMRRAGCALLVDDEELVRASTADMLTDLGYDVVEASSGREALERLGSGRHFDLLVTDHLMPGMTGTDLARAAQGLFPGLPMLLVSGYAEVEGIAPDLPRLTKPFRQKELAAAIAGIERTT